MKRSLTMGAVTALVVGVSVPAAALAAPQSMVVPTAYRPAVVPQVVAASRTPLAAVARDAFTVEVIVPEVVVPVLAFASSQFSGSLAMWPASGGVNDGFGYRGSEFHGGIDIMAGHGASIVAASAGVVTTSSYEAGGWGQYIEIDHGGGISTLYSHLIEGSQAVVPGQTVNAGDFIGLVGNSGYTTVSHLHFEVHVGGTRVDPMGWLP